MKKLTDNEFLSAPEFSDPPEEFGSSPENNGGGKEFGQSLSGVPTDEKQSALSKNLKKALLFFAAGSVICTSVMLTSFGSLFFGASSPYVPPTPSASVIETTGASKPTATGVPVTTVAASSGAATSQSETSAPSTTTSQTAVHSTTETAPMATTATTAPLSGEIADREFPLLSNLEPNGYINDEFGVLDEEYICLERDGKYDYLVFHEKEGQTLIGADGQPVKAVSVEGMSYFEEENALYLRNFHGGNLYQYIPAVSVFIQHLADAA